MAAQNGTDRAGDRAATSDTKAGAGPKPLAVERLTHHDINDICALYRRVWEGFRSDLPPDLVKAWEPTPLEFTSWMEGVTYFAARRDGKMIGAIGCRVSEGSCQLMHLAVDAESRRQGVAAALTTAAIDWAKRNTCHSVWVDALAKFTAASEMFKRLGFVEAGILHRHYWSEDVRLLEMIL